MNTKRKQIWFTVCLTLISISLSACGPSAAQQQATITQIAVNILATQTAGAPTITSTATATATLTPTSTSTLTATPVPPTPTFTLTPTSKVINWTQSQVLAGHTDWVNGLAFSPDSQTLASGSFDGSIILWDVSSGEQQKILSGHWDGVRTVAYSPDGLTLASGSDDKTIILWNTSTGAKQQTLTGHKGIVFSVAFSPDGQTLASGSFDTTVILWDANTGEQMKTLDGHTGGVQSLSFSPDGQMLASAGQDGNIILWDTIKGTQLQALGGEQSGMVDSVAFSPDGQALASGRPKRINIWNTNTWEIELTLTGHSGWGVILVYYPDGRTLASKAYDDPVILWDVEKGEQQQSLTVPDTVDSLAFSPDGLTLAAGLGDGKVLLWKAPDTTPTIATRTPAAALPTEPLAASTNIPAITSEAIPTPAGLSAEGQAAYDNIAHILLTIDELDAVCGFEDVGWVFTGDGPGLYLTCRTFERPDFFIHTKFFSCVGRVVEGFDLEKDDLGWYEVLETYESAYDFEYPQQINAYYTESGRLGIDYIVHINDFVYITGLELVTPLGSSFDSMFGEYEDQVLYEALKIMVSRAEADPPEKLDFPPGTSSKAGD